VQKNKTLKELKVLMLRYKLKERAKTEDKLRMYNFDEVRSLPCAQLIPVGGAIVTSHINFSSHCSYSGYKAFYRAGIVDHHFFQTTVSTVEQ